MSWKQAFFVQAQSDHAVLDRLNHPAIEYCHRLHYLQMVTEKLSKALLANSRDPDPPLFTHSAFVKMLRNVKGRPDLRRILGFRDTAAFGSYIDSLLGLAQQIERLAPSIAGMTKPNPEYPWRDSKTAKILSPSEYGFPDFNPRNPKMQKITALLRALLQTGM